MTRRRLWLPVALVMAACSAAPPMPDPAPTHPASPLANETPEPAPSRTLVMPERRLPMTNPAQQGH